MGKERERQEWASMDWAMGHERESRAAQDQRGRGGRE